MRKNKMKAIMAMLLAATLTLSSTISSLAAGWHQDGNGWWYEQEDGSYPINTWYKDKDDSWYFFNEAGYMIHNCYRYVDGNVYAFGSDGRWTGSMFTDIIPGAWIGNQYVNEWSGFHLNVPAGYEIIPSPSLDLDDPTSLQEFEIKIPDGTGSKISLEYDNAYDFADYGAITPEYMTSIYSVALALCGFTIEDVSSVTLGGKDYIKLTADGSGIMKCDFYCRKAGSHYLECLTALYWAASQPAVQGLLANVY